MPVRGGVGPSLSPPPPPSTTPTQGTEFTGTTGGESWGDGEEGPGMVPSGGSEEANGEGSVDRWGLCWKEALRVRDLQVINACPVVICPHQNPQLQPLLRELTKELRQLVRETGMSSANTIAFLETLSSTYVFMPLSWKTLLKISLTNTQYNVWLNDFRESCSEYANDPRAGVTAHQLTGNGNYSSIDEQVKYNREIYEVIAKHALRAMRKLPTSDRDNILSFTKIIQCLTEPYSQFLDRLQFALNRKNENDEAREIINRLLKMRTQTIKELCKPFLRGRAAALPNWFVPVKGLAQWDIKLTR
ncbi:endogenous retrovirus group K member 5 Gag polyprotein-like [Manacus candei]|uniref:endogenous retrovirus group K member 5 Gag polyprotein-like n=1 Tax=Manacus candei TaxID=415023 RepID=UPI002227C6E6|nr:endogenous retrovirus group K member 5 Gag polyprotein-like [Manacus candei]